MNQCVNYQHNIILSPQPTGMTCWSAATTMLFGSRFSAGPGKAKLAKNGGLKSDLSNVYKFAESYGLRVYSMQSWSVDGLIQLIRRGPVIMIGAQPSMHAVVIGGISSDGTPEGTYIKIYDPWPPGVGRIHNENYAQWMTSFPLSTVYMLQR